MSARDRYKSNDSIIKEADDGQRTNGRPTGLILIRGRKVDRESFHRRYM